MEAQSLEEHLNTENNDMDDYGSDDGGVNFDNLDNILEARASKAGMSIISPTKLEKVQEEEFEEFNFDQLVQEREASIYHKEEPSDIINISRNSDDDLAVQEAEEDDNRFDFDALMKEKRMSLIIQEHD